MGLRSAFQNGKVLLLSSRIGGHWNAALAIAEALERLSGGQIQTEIVDVHRKPYMRFPVSLLADQYEPLIRTYPRLWGLVFHLTNRLILFEALSWLTRLLCKRAAFEDLASKRPDVVVSTIFMYNQTRLLRSVMSATGTAAQFVTVVTDPVTIHWGWGAFEADWFVVPSVIAEDTCVRRFRIPRDRVLRLGFPVRLGFREVTDCQRLKEDLGLEAGAFSVLFVGGAAGAGSMAEFVRAVHDARLGVHLLVVCGHNERLRHTLQTELDSRVARVYGFVHNLEALMNVANVVVTKAGPTTISEALACNRPVCIMGNLPGQEEGNPDYYEDLGVALPVRSATDLVERLRQFLEKPSDQLSVLQKNIQRIGDPNGVMDIAARVVSLVAQADASV